jgi:uncharacterized membrane protein
MTYAHANTDTFSTGEFRIGKVISKALNVYFQNFISFTFIATVVAIPSVGLGLIQGEQQVQGQPPGLEQVGLILLTILVLLILSGLTTAIILHATFQHMSGRVVRLGQSVGRGLARTLSLLLLMLLVGLGVAFGMLLLIIPGIYLAVRWHVAVPANVVESLSPLRSMARSRDLTKGFRWKIFALMILAYLMTIGGGQLITFASQAALDMWTQLGILVIWQGVAGAFWSVLVTVAYYYLRVAKEGIDVEQIAAVFD